MSKFSQVKTFKKIDIFGEGVAFNISGSGTVNSCIGAFFSLTILILTIY